MNGQIIPEETEKSIEVKQENATFLVIGDKAYTSEIIEEYNRNAEAKTEDFNANAESKIASYNSNAADRTTAFNNNYDNKIVAFDSNANTQTEEFDSHVLMQTNTFNNNAISTIANYNINAEQKTYEFNQNALSYKEGIEDNTNRIKRLETDIFDSGSASASAINLQDSTLAEFKEVSVDGVGNQEATSINNGDEYDSPSPDYPQEIEVIEDSFNLISCGKNLIDLSGLSGTKSGITITHDGDYLVFNGIPDGDYRSLYTIVDPSFLKNGYTYRASNEIYPSKIYQQISATDKETGQITYFFTQTSSKVFTVNTDKYEYKYSLMAGTSASIGTLTDFKNKYQIEEGTVATSFEPYQSTTTTITLPENEFAGKISDTVKDKFVIRYNDSDARYHLYLEKQVGKIILDGSENWILVNSTGDYYEYQANNVLSPLSPSTYTFPLSTHFKNLINNRIVVNGHLLLVRIPVSAGITTLDELKNWLSENNVTVYYELAEPYTLDLGIVDMPLGYYPVTNVYTTCDLQPTIAVSYYRDFKGTINTIQDDLTSASSKISTLESDVNTLKEQVAQLMTSVTSEESEGVE